MIRCSCCELRIGHHVEPCDCTQGYCSRCLLCEAHCSCTPAPERVSLLKLVAAIAVIMFSGFAFGAGIGERNWLGPWPFAIAGAVVGALLTMTAAGELDWFLESRSPTGEDGSVSNR